MSTTPVIKGNGNILWGTDGVYSSGIIVSGRTLRTADTKLVLDNNAFAAAKVYFNHRNECEFEAITQSSVPALAIGDAVSIGGVANCLVDDIETIWVQDGEQKWKVKATAYDGIAA